MREPRDLIASARRRLPVLLLVPAVAALAACSCPEPPRSVAPDDTYDPGKVPTGRGKAPASGQASICDPADAPTRVAAIADWLPGDHLPPQRPARVRAAG